MSEARGELQALRRCEHLGSGFSQSCHQERVGGGHGRIASRATASRRQSRHRDDVLDRYRLPGQGSVRRPVRSACHRGHRVERPAQAVKALVGGEQIEVVAAAGTLTPLDRDDQFLDPAQQKAFQRAEDGASFCGAVPDGEVTVDARVRLSGQPVELCHPVQRAGQVSGVESVQRQGRDRCLGQDLSGDGGEQRPVRRICEDGMDRQVADGRGEQRGAVGLLAPDVAEDVGGGFGVGDIRRQACYPAGAATVQFADHERAPVAAQHHAWLNHVSTEVDHRRDHPFWPERPRQGLRSQAVLQ